MQTQREVQGSAGQTRVTSQTSLQAPLSAWGRVMTFLQRIAEAKARCDHSLIRFADPEQRMNA